MILDSLCLEDVELVRRWRNQCLETLRTPYRLSEDMQSIFYAEEVCNRESHNRYWAIREDIDIVHPDVNIDIPSTELVGMGGLQSIEWENSRAEISLIIDPIYWGKGFGQKAVDLILGQGFYFMGLKNIWGEVYDTNKRSKEFWSKVIENYSGWEVLHPNTKFWDGITYSSTWFQIDRNSYNNPKEK